MDNFLNRGDHHLLLGYIRVDLGHHRVGGHRTRQGLQLSQLQLSTIDLPLQLFDLSGSEVLTSNGRVIEGRCYRLLQLGYFNLLASNCTLKKTDLDRYVSGRPNRRLNRSNVFYQ